MNDPLSDTATAQICAFQLRFTNPSRYLSCLADRVHRSWLTTSYPNEVHGVLLGWFFWILFPRIFCASGIWTQGTRTSQIGISPFLTIELDFILNLICFYFSTAFIAIRWSRETLRLLKGSSSEQRDTALWSLRKLPFCTAIWQVSIIRRLNMYICPTGCLDETWDRRRAW